MSVYLAINTALLILLCKSIMLHEQYFVEKAIERLERFLPVWGYPPLFVHNAQFLQRRNLPPFLQGVWMFPAVGHPFLRGKGLLGNGNLPFFRDFQRPMEFRGKGQQAAVNLWEPSRKICGKPRIIIREARFPNIMFRLKLFFF